MTDKKEPSHIFIYETRLGELASDLSMFGSITAAFWVNHHFIASNGWLNALLFMAFWVATFARASESTARMTFGEADEFIKARQ